MRSFHRLLAVVVSLVMLYLGGTGTLIQILDLQAILGGAPETDAVIKSINEGKYGNFGYQVLTDRELTASSLPSGLNMPEALSAALARLRQDSPEAPAESVELRMAGDTAIGQVAIGNKAAAFDLATGEPVEAVETRPTGIPPSLRQDLKELHRFWSRRDVPGVWFELASGIALWALLITGMILYVKLLRARVNLGRKNPLWIGNGLWRGLHRVVSVTAAILLIAVAGSGTWLGFESVWHTFVSIPRTSVASPLNDADIPAMAATTLAAFRAGDPDTPIKVLRVRVYAGMKQGIVVTGGAETRQLVYNAETGKAVSLTEPGYPASGFPLGIQVHEDVKHFHSGFMFGLPARVMDLLAGLALLFLSVSGLVMYADMWLKRRKIGRKGVFWL
jgi:hypothetical protein